MMRWVTISFAMFLVACQGTLDMDENTDPVVSPYAQAAQTTSAGADSQPEPASGPADQSQPAPADTTPAPEPEVETAPGPETEPAPEPEPEPEPVEEETLPEPGSVVEFTIAEGTGTGPWNTASDPVVVYVGQVLKITNFDNADHQMHATNAAPVPHGDRLQPGQSQEYVVSSALTVGNEAEMWDHNHGRSASFWVEAREYPDP